QLQSTAAYSLPLSGEGEVLRPQAGLPSPKRDLLGTNQRRDMLGADEQGLGKERHQHETRILSRDKRGSTVQHVHVSGRVVPWNLYVDRSLRVGMAIFQPIGIIGRGGEI